MRDGVPAVGKRRRLNERRALQKSIAATKTARWVGRNVEVLVDGKDELGRTFGRIRQGKRAIVLKAGDIAPGELIDLRVIQATAGQLTGLPAA